MKSLIVDFFASVQVTCFQRSMPVLDNKKLYMAVQEISKAIIYFCK